MGRDDPLLASKAALDHGPECGEFEVRSEDLAPPFDRAAGGGRVFRP